MWATFWGLFSEFIGGVIFNENKIPFFLPEGGGIFRGLKSPILKNNFFFSSPQRGEKGGGFFLGFFFSRGGFFYSFFYPKK